MAIGPFRLTTSLLLFAVFATFAVASLLWLGMGQQASQLREATFENRAKLERIQERTKALEAQLETALRADAIDARVAELGLPLRPTDPSQVLHAEDFRLDPIELEERPTLDLASIP